MKTHRMPRATALRLTALASAAALALFALAALSAPPRSGAAPPDPGTITVRAGNYIGTTTEQTFTLEKRVFTGSTDCTSGGGPVVTVSGVDQDTGHAITLAPTDSVLLTVPQSPIGAFFAHISEQNGPFVSWFPDPATAPLATYPPGPGNQICLSGPADADPHSVTANFYAGIELFDSCGNERYAFRPGETVQVRVTGGLTHMAEPHRLQAGGGTPNECTVVPPPPAFTTVHVTTDPFTYVFTLPATLPAHCSGFGTTEVTGNYRVVAYDVPGCGCNRNDVRFTVQADAPIPSCPLACPGNITRPAEAGSCGALVNFAPPAGAPGETVNCDRAPGSFFPVGTTTVACNSSLGRECSFDVTVTDGEAPSVSGVTASPSVLWPPDHSLRDVELAYTASDNCGGNLTCSVTSVESSEPPDGTGDGDTSPDFELAGPTLVRLRAERSGGGAGRTYAVTVTCTDGVNSTSKTVSVTVPKSKKK